MQPSPTTLSSSMCMEHSVCFELAKGAPAAVVAIFASVLAGLIAYRQYRVAKAKLQLDLFEKRYELFEHVWALASTVMHGSIPNMLDAVRVNVTNSLPKIEFLFDPDIAAYVREINENSAELWEIHRLSMQPGHVLSAKYQKRWQFLKAWFEEQALGGCQGRFGKYLDIKKW
ncbi:hypothetical protein [Burkholderia gladioli]|uniref:hypothetical protein n=1 Tax=Burkholderia gladioli TaxID=28095 RepID=UPI00163FB17E|nr:hypothetical protein [Burkholderia gladioli]